jgi:hypothetical protein
MQTNEPKSRVFAALGAGIKSTATSWLALLGLMLVALASPALAQETVLISASPARVTEPFNFNGTNSVNVNLSIAGGTNEIDLTLSGLPAGAQATLSKTVFTNGSAGSTLTFFLTNVAEGVYWLTLNATNNATNFLNFPLQVGDVWSGAGANKNWSTAGNWNGGTVPGVNDDVIFNQGGAQNVTNTNSIVDVTTTIASLRFATTNSSTNFQNIMISPNVTLNITGTNSLSELRDMQNLATSMNGMISGQGGILNVANENGNIALLNDGNIKSLLDMQKLGLFKADVNRVGVGDINAYPNYTNLQANESAAGNGVPKRYIPVWNLAMTNIIKAVYADPYNYTNATNRAYALELGNNGNQATSSSAQLLISMGVSNLFELDSLCIAGNGGTTATLNFNTNFASLNPTAYFRNTDGVSRMSTFTIADASSYFTNATGNTKANSFNGVDFADGKGYVNALVDKFIMSRDAPISINGGITAQSQMELGQGVFDCNTAILGDQAQGNQPQINYCQATLTVSNTAVFVVRTNLELGYETASINDTSDPGSTYGLLNVSLGGTVQANQINVGGVTKTSGLVGSNDGHGGLNQINLSGGGTLIVSNTIADSTPNGALGLLNFAGNGILELFIDGNKLSTQTNVYVSTVTTTGSGNMIKIGGIANLTLPAQVPLIQYASGTPTLGVTVPSGYSGAIINNGAGKTIDVYLTAGAPKTLVWRGYQNSTWDTSTKNWLDLNTGLQTNFANLDVVSFDDMAGIPTSISLSGLLIPGAVGMTNSVNNYTFNGPGTTSGSAVLSKSGTGSLDIEATTTLSVNLNGGTLTSGGTINSITSASGTTVNISGTVSAGLTCSGTATSSGTISGFLDVKGGGIFTNLNTLNGPITLETNSFVNNEGTIQNMFPSGSVATNAFLLNSGQINDGGSVAANNGTLTINGTFEDTGAGSMTLFRLTLAATCTFIPGDGGVGLTTINSDGSAVTGSFPGRLSLAAGSKTLIYVNGTSSTKVNCGYVDYGPSQNGQAQNGCTFVITNLGSAYTAGQVFQVVGNQAGGNPFPDGTSTNSFPILVPDKPAPGLAWDLSHLWPSGQIGVIVPPTFTLTNSFARISTNIVSSFSWPQAEFGWALEIQQNTLQVGLSTNWTRIAGSWTNASMNITNTAYTSNNAVFYRLVYP